MLEVGKVKIQVNQIVSKSIQSFLRFVGTILIITKKILLYKSLENVIANSSLQIYLYVLISRQKQCNCFAPF